MECPVCPCKDIDDQAKPCLCPNCGRNLDLLRMMGQLAPALYDEGLGLARQGDLEEAMIKASGVIALEGGHIQARILLAKILWRLGWREGAVAQLREAERLGAGEKVQPLLTMATVRSASNKKTVLVIIAAMVVLVCLGIAAFAFRQANLSRTKASEAAKTTAEIQARYDLSRSQQEELQAAYSKLRQQQTLQTPAPESSEKLETVLHDLTNSCNLEPQMQGGSAVVKFPDGIFSFASVKLTLAGSQALARIGKVLASHRLPLLVVIEGHTDNTPARDQVKMSNAVLGYARAKAAYEAMGPALAEKNDVRFLLNSQGEADPPFLNDTRENRLRNCTVVLRLIPFAQAGRAGSAAINAN